MSKSTWFQTASCWLGYHSYQLKAVSSAEVCSTIPLIGLVIPIALLELDKTARKYVLCQCYKCQAYQVFSGGRGMFGGYTSFSRDSLLPQNIGTLLDYKRKPLHWEVAIPGWNITHHPITKEKFDSPWVVSANEDRSHLPPNRNQKYEL
jgi:hypothetical protein